VNCIVFMVDANDRPRFHESKLELDVRRCPPCVACCMADVDMPYVAHPTKLRCTMCAAARLIERLPSLPSTSYQCAADIYTSHSLQRCLVGAATPGDGGSPKCAVPNFGQ
jgi:hypothetical protein